MLSRIVKMSFHPEQVKIFLANFEDNKEFIRNSPGCQLLELYQDQQNSSIFFTYSYWDSEIDLNNYRNSELFKDVWSKTKILFNSKPEAWSLDKIVCLS